MTADSRAELEARLAKLISRDSDEAHESLHKALVQKRRAHDVGTPDDVEKALGAVDEARVRLSRVEADLASTRRALELLDREGS
jgi:outer membrane protein TolC